EDAEALAVPVRSAQAEPVHVDARAEEPPPRLVGPGSVAVAGAVVVQDGVAEADEPQRQLGARHAHDHRRGDHQADARTGPQPVDVREPASHDSAAAYDGRQALGQARGAGGRDLASDRGTRGAWALDGSKREANRMRSTQNCPRRAIRLTLCLLAVSSVAR